MLGPILDQELVCLDRNTGRRRGQARL